MNEHDFMASFLSEMSEEEFEAFSDAMYAGVCYEQLFKKQEKKRSKKHE